MTQVCEVKNKAYLFLVTDQHPLLFSLQNTWSSSCNISTYILHVFISDREKTVSFILLKFYKLNLLNKQLLSWGFDGFLYQDITPFLATNASYHDLKTSLVMKHRIMLPD